MRRNYVPAGILLSLIALGAAGCGDGNGGPGDTEGASSGGGGQDGAGGGTGAGAPTSSVSAGPGSSTSTGGSASTSSGNPGTTTATSSTSGGGAGVSCSYPSGYTDGSITWYTLDMGSTEVNCSYQITGRNPDVVAHVPFGGGQYFAAMNTADYDSAAMCGACVEVTRDDGRSVQAMVVDQCPIATNPKCTAGHIDLSKNAFLQIGEEREGYLGTTHGGAAGKISWKYIPCPSAGDVSFRLKDEDNRYWNEILVEGHSHPIEKVEVEINGAWQAATRQSYNYWVVGDGNMGAPPYHVRATDINGSTVEARLELKGGAQSAGAQLAACQ
ncbi:expansin EXLX1 family cellulose-binding protein [Sorangium sp. So ce131]|uniref:expansin EXLX1 family cellulose-binding protein n=1 Tax=Sorangium sp. So ce131 TaxID=3133282 RepID=UPI003F63E775